MSHVGSVDDYRTVVRVRNHGGRRKPIYGTRYLARCSCGASLSGGDWISTKRWWRSHKSAAPLAPKTQNEGGK